VQGSSEDAANHTQTLEFSGWKATIQYGMPSFGNGMEPKGNSPADGGVVLAEPMADEFYVAVHHARVDFTPVAKGDAKRLFLSVEEVEPTADGGWKTLRVWNGDQTDYGLNLPAEGKTVLRVRLTTF